MTIYIVGRRSYIGNLFAEHFKHIFYVRLVAVRELAEISICEDDIIVNCAFASVWHEKRAPNLGFDGFAARIAQRTGARYVMISSRAVYTPRVDPPLSEREPPAPTTIYGENKATFEAGLQRLLGTRLLILRLSNVFGSEPSGRRTFVSTALESLDQQGAIELNMPLETRKDFVPASLVSRAALVLVSQGSQGIFNIGSGIPMPVGEVAKALVRGYGGGKIRVIAGVPAEEFCLDVSNLNHRSGLQISAEELIRTLELTARNHHG